MRHIISVLLGLSLVAGTAFASDSASPGDALYPIKLAKEKIQLNLTISQEAKARLQEKFAEQRLVELQEISSQNALPFSGSKDHGKNSSGLSGDQTDELNGDSSATTTLESQKHHKLQIEAKDSADAAVSAAVRALGDVQKKLKAKGQEQSADSINRDIIRLRQKAQDQGLDVPESNNRQQTPEGASLSTNASTSLTNDIFNEQGLNQ